MKIIYIKTFLRASISLSFLSAVADRFGIWSNNISVWGNWNNFLIYTQSLIPWLYISFIPYIAIIATIAEIIFSLALLLGFKTALFAKLSAYLLLFFAIAMISSTGFKGVFDYSVLTASAAAFSLSSIKDKFFEIDSLNL